MGILQRALSRMRNAMRRDDPIQYFQWIGLDAPTGIVVTAETALQISAVWACVMAVTNGIAPCAWNVLEVSGDKRTRLADDPVDHLLNVRPNEEMTAMAFKEAMLIAALTWGNGYAEITKSARGQVSALYPLLPDRMTPRRRREPPYQLYYEYVQQNGERTELETSQVFHLRGPGITGLMGDNLVARAAKTLGLAAAQERFASTYFGNNTVIGGVLQHPKKLTAEAHAKLKGDWEDKYKGPFKANRPAILEEGMTWQPFSNSAEAAQLTSSRTFQVEEICRWFGVPPHKVQHLLRATFNNIEHLGIEFVRDALTPWAKRMQQEADFKLFPQRAPWRSTELDMAWLTHGDAISRFTAYNLGRNMGVYSVNDILRMEGKNTIGPEGDIRLCPLNMTTLKRMSEDPPPPKPTQPAGQPGGKGGAAGGEKKPAGGKAGEGSDGSTGTKGPDSTALGNSIARDALLAVFGSIFERYAKRLENRELDLRRRNIAPAAIAANMARERERLRAVVSDESSLGIDLLAKRCARHGVVAREVHELAVLLALDAIDGGRSSQDLAGGVVDGCERCKVLDYSPDQDRDDHGRFTTEGGGSEGSGEKSGGGESGGSADPAAAARDIHHNALDIEPRTTGDMRTLENDKAKLVGLEYAVKSESSIARKLADFKTENEQAGKPFTREVALAELKDSVRYTLMTDVEHYNAQVPSALKSLEADGYKVTKFKNYWDDPIYKGINVNMRAPSGTIIELQFHTPESFHTKEHLNHKPYEEYRLRATPEERKRELYAKMAANTAANVRIPPGASSLKHP
jgi:HK97 family phage portal protein